MEQTGAGFLLRLEPDVRATLDPLPDVAGVPSSSRCRRPAAARSCSTSARSRASTARRRSRSSASAGSTSCSREDGPEAAAAVARRARADVQAAADEHGVTFLESDVDRDGGRIILVAGAPQTSGDDEDRLLRARPRDRRRRTCRCPSPSASTAAASSPGEVGASVPPDVHDPRRHGRAGGAADGPRARRTRSWSRRRRSSGRDGASRRTELEPFTSRASASPSRAFVLGALAARGGATPGDEAAVRRPRARARGARRRRSRLCGWASARSSSSSATRASASRGSSRSCASSAADMTVAHGPLRAVRGLDALRRLPRPCCGPARRGLNGDATRTTRGARPSGSATSTPSSCPGRRCSRGPLDVEHRADAGGRRARPRPSAAPACTASSARCSRRLLDSPTLLVFEDVHWMDDASSDLLRHLGDAALDAAPWLRARHARPDEPGLLGRRGHAAAPGADAAARAAAGGRREGARRRPRPSRRSRDEDVDAIAERAGGNPLFLQELARLDGSRGTRRRSSPRPSRRSSRRGSTRSRPPTARCCAGRRCSGMSFSARRASPTCSRTIASAASDSEAWDRLAEFLERDPDVAGGFRFRHALIRDAAYEGLSYRRRRELHAACRGGRRAAGTARRRTEYAELLSLHCRAPGATDETWRYSLAAGRARPGEVRRTSRPPSFYRRALESRRRLPDLDAGRARSRLGGARRRARSSRASSTRRPRLRGGPPLRPKDARSRSGSCARRALVRECMGKYSEALRWYGRGLTAAEGLADDDERRAHSTPLPARLRQVRFRQGAFGECIRRCRAASSRTRRRRHGDLARPRTPTSCCTSSTRCSDRPSARRSAGSHCRSTRSSAT